ncbi:MAG: hypothetical protein ACYCXZ_03880 [Coriobacteriia bacterium]
MEEYGRGESRNSGGAPARFVVCVVPDEQIEQAAAAFDLYIRAMQFARGVLKDGKKGEPADREAYAHRGLQRDHRPEVAEELFEVALRAHGGERHLDQRDAVVLGSEGLFVGDARTIYLADGDDSVELQVTEGSFPATTLGKGLRRIRRLGGAKYKVEAVVEQGQGRSAASPAAAPPSSTSLYTAKYECCLHPDIDMGDPIVDGEWQCSPDCAEHEICDEEHRAGVIRLVRIALCRECHRPLKRAAEDAPFGEMVCTTDPGFCSLSGKRQTVDRSVHDAPRGRGAA